jgi:hypothetical protein
MPMKNMSFGQALGLTLISPKIQQYLKTMLCSAALGAVAMSTQAQNLLVDPSAESQISTPNPATGYGQGWSFFNGATFSSAQAESGSWSIAEQGRGGYSVPGTYQQFAATAGQQFTMSGFGLTTAALTGGDFGLLQITYFSGANGTGSNLGTVETSPGNADGSAVQINGTSALNTWIPMSVTATAPTGSQSMQAFAITIDPVAMTAPIYFDNMTLTATAAPEPSTLALAGLGSLGMLSLLRRRNA